MAEGLRGCLDFGFDFGMKRSAKFAIARVSKDMVKYGQLQTNSRACRKAMSADPAAASKGVAAVVSQGD